MGLVVVPKVVIDDPLTALRGVERSGAELETCGQILLYAPESIRINTPEATSFRWGRLSEVVFGLITNFWLESSAMVVAREFSHLRRLRLFGSQLVPVLNEG